MEEFEMLLGNANHGLTSLNLNRDLWKNLGSVEANVIGPTGTDDDDADRW
jgi:hypothetical protein